MMNSIKNTIEYLGLNFKKELIKVIAVDSTLLIAVALSFIFLKQRYIYVLLLIGTLMLNYMYLNSFQSRKTTLINAREDEFVSLISYFKIFIQHQSNVYHTFESLIPYASEWMANEIHNLLLDIDHDKSVQPFISFAKQFKSPVIEDVMVAIFQMIDEGENVDRLSHFSVVFNNFAREHQESLLDLEQKSLDMMNNFPMVGAGLVAVILTFGVIGAIGELINVV